MLGEAQCGSAFGCHAVYQPTSACVCSGPGCCIQFSSCADGAQADCNGMAACPTLPPACDGPYVVSYSGQCYEGCVLQSECTPDCRTTGCADPNSTCQQCFATFACIPTGAVC